MSPTAAALLHGVAETESGHDYGAIGVVTATGNRAYGKYQVMDYNIGNWTEEHLGTRMTISEFLESPVSQEKLAGVIFTKRIGQYGNLEDPVAVWFSGRPALNNDSCDAHTCVPEYIRKVLLAML